MIQCLHLIYWKFYYAMVVSELSEFNCISKAVEKLCTEVQLSNLKKYLKNWIGIVLGVGKELFVRETF